jgi:hypothetical protein
VHAARHEGVDRVDNEPVASGDPAVQVEHDDVAMLSFVDRHNASPTASYD